MGGCCSIPKDPQPQPHRPDAKVYGHTAASGQNEPPKFTRIKDCYETIEEVQEALRRAGLESSQLVVAVDFTKSNEWSGKNSFQGRSLHAVDHSGSSCNPYEEAITVIARTLEVFDDDHLIPCYGFGDHTTHDKQVFSFMPNNQPCQGLTSVISRYKELVPYVNLAGPTSFAPAIWQAIKCVVESGMEYHILVIIADGQVTHTCMNDTIAAIVAASDYPLSIIMIGVGDGPWDDMQNFDDGLPTRRFDNFQFVNFTELALRANMQNLDVRRREANFALQALMEIPEQYWYIQRLKLLNRPHTLPRSVPSPLPPPLPVTGVPVPNTHSAHFGSSSLR